MKKQEDFYNLTEVNIHITVRYENCIFSIKLRFYQEENNFIIFKDSYDIKI